MIFEVLNVTYYNMGSFNLTLKPGKDVDDEDGDVDDDVGNGNLVDEYDKVSLHYQSLCVS